jgi:hypothetical protein
MKKFLSVLADELRTEGERIAQQGDGLMGVVGVEAAIFGTISGTMGALANCIELHWRRSTMKIYALSVEVKISMWVSTKISMLVVVAIQGNISTTPVHADITGQSPLKTLQTIAQMPAIWKPAR